MYTPKIFLLVLIITVLAYLAHLFWKKIMDPRRSIGYLLLYVGAHVFTVLLLVFIFGVFLNQYKDFFFNR